MYSKAVRLLIVRDRQQPNRLLYIAFSSFQGVVADDMKDSSERLWERRHPCLLRLHYLASRQAMLAPSSRFIISGRRLRPSERLLRKCTAGAVRLLIVAYYQQPDRLAVHLRLLIGRALSAKLTATTVH